VEDQSFIYRSSKTFRGFPCAHRRWRHRGHCSQVHGYDREVTIWFEAHVRDENGFVMDFSLLKPIQAWLESQFDHTLLLDEDDPLVPKFAALAREGACRLVLLPDVGMEGSGRHVFDYVHGWVQDVTEGRVWVHSVEMRENSKNSALVCRGQMGQIRPA